LFCPGCGTNNQDNVRFCYRCGRQLHDGTSQPTQSGPAWQDFVEAPPTPELIPEPPPVLVQPELPPLESLPAQVVLGVPRRELPIATVAGLVLAFAALVGIGFGAYYALQNLDKDSLGLSGGSGTSTAPAILVSLTSTCKDTKSQDCNLVWDLTSVQAGADGLRIDYEVRATGQAGCSVVIQPDQAVTAHFEGLGRPGPFVEGARGRYYPLTSSEGLTSTGGNLACDQSGKGAWIFSAVTGEPFVKLRYPGLPSGRIELASLAAAQLPANDALSVIPVQQTACETTQRQACTGVWEIGPYGLAADGTPTVFFAVRFDGPPGCQVNWQDDLEGSKAQIAQGRRGIGLELENNAGYLLLTGGGGISSQTTAQPCGTVLAGFWRFTAGKVSSIVNLNYPDFPVVQIPLKP
jgi:hypothetical protein